MSDRTHISDELLNAFVDGELDSNDKEQIFALMTKDPALNKRVCELRSCRELVQLAFQNAPPAPIRSRHLAASGIHRRPSWMNGIAASVLVAMGMLIGTQLDYSSNGNGTSIAINENPGTARVAMAKSATTKVLFHLNSRKPEVVRETLDELEGVLRYYRETGEKAQVELITNGGGIDLLRADISPYAKRILSMQNRYTNLSFVTCQNSIDRLQRERGITARLLPGIVVIDSGVAQIMRRQQEGWAYIQV